MEHGLFCLGCCWFLMALMFVSGVMNLLWMAGIAIYVLIEKVIPQCTWGNVVTWAVGGVMVAWGGWMVFGGHGV
jgi:predicted metal-binding membrane protein